MAHEKCETDAQASEALHRHNGARIKFYCDHVFYSGIIDEIIPEAKMVKLRHTKIADSDTYFGNLCFHFSNIKSFTVIESAESVNRIPRNTYLSNILRKARTCPDNSVCKVLYGDRLSEESDDEDCKDEETEEEFTLNLPLHLKSRLPDDSIVLDEFNLDFKMAICHISDQRIIGVSLEGPVISRFGKLTWVSISTRYCVYMFDIEILKQEAFDRGLRYIFEAKSIKKVFHNCRYASDLLASLYSTRLTNVFDTQVANFIVDLQRYKDKYEFKNVSSLECCLRNYLKLSPEYLFQKVELESEDKFTYYTKRPISNAFRLDLVNKVLYLILLQEILANELLAPLRKLTTGYLRVLAKASDSEFYSVGKELSPPDAIPPGILMYGIQVIKFKKPERKALVPLVRNLKNLKTGEIIVPLEKIGQSSGGASAEAKNSQACDGALTKMFDSSLKISKCVANKDAESISVRPSYRHMDEVYHKLVNKVCSNQTEVNVKPIDTYISTFSVQKSSSDDISPVESTGCNHANLCAMLPGTLNSGQTSGRKQIPEEQADVWAKIHDETNTSDTPYLPKRKIQFVPA